jgi:transcriptional regulator with PAS, ATPase and Fis domain
MLSPNRVLVVGNDPGMTQAVQNQLRHCLERVAPSCRFDTIRPHVGPQTDGLLLALVAQPADGPALRTMLQELQLLGYPPRVVVLEAPTVTLGDALGPFGSRVAWRYPWRDSARDVAALVRGHTGNGPNFHDPASESLAERINHRLLSSTPSLVHLVESLSLAAAHDVTVLLDGETGTGKTFLARLIHDCSPRTTHRFLHVSCGALAPSLIASELFGHAKGAFTGADAAKVGKFAAVGQGTLLLDEIDTLSLEHQANLLRVIETGEFEPVGSNETQHCTARVIVATNWHLEEAVERGAFRRDLFYRLNVMPFHLPPLRERPQDIEPLVRSLVARFAAKFRKDLTHIHPDTLRVLAGFDWPGNIRQLENVVQQAVLLSSEPELLVKNLAPIVQNRCPQVFPGRTPAGGALEQSRQAAERVSIMRALEASGYSRTRAAAALGISRVTLYKKMREYGLLARPARPRSGAAG